MAHGSGLMGHGSSLERWLAAPAQEKKGARGFQGPGPPAPPFFLAMNPEPTSGIFEIFPDFRNVLALIGH